ncbi:MAG: hypothetical protein IJJ26_09440, partial [Victivallales bacterium]|nr:hypothetical protein [Victivallales bacterium]
PLYFHLQNLPLAPTWKPDFPPSGDAIGECLENHTLEEALVLTSRMVQEWSQGTRILNSLRSDFLDAPERIRDIGLANALHLQFHSAQNVFEFYLLRKRYRNPNTSLLEKREIIARLQAILQQEIAHSRQMKDLCQHDSRLGFHSEAEVHLYSPRRLDWRIQQLQTLLDGPLADAAHALQNGTTPPETSPSLQHTIHCNASHPSPIHTPSLEAVLTYLPEANELTLSLKVPFQPDASDEVRLFFLDNDASTFPWRITLFHSHGSCTANDNYHAATISFDTSHDAWTAIVRLPLLLWPDFHDTNACFFHLRHHRIAQGTRHVYPWPPENTPPRERLNLGDFQPDHAAFIVCDK